MMERWKSVSAWGGLVTLVAGTAIAAGLLMAPSTASGSAQRATPECRNRDVTASYKEKDHATSHTFGKIILTNTSSRTCFVQGYGGLSYVGKGNGTQIGAAADRTPSKRPRVVLQPGDKARSLVSETSYAPFPKKQCKPTKVDGFRVYAPDTRHSQFIAHPTTGCANTAIHLLSHKAFH